MLRMLLTKQDKTTQEAELLATILDSYASYNTSGRNNSETACLIARDFMMLYQSSGASQQPQQQLQIESQMGSHGQQGFIGRGMQQVGAQHHQQSQLMQQQGHRLQQLGNHSQSSNPGMGMHQSAIGQQQNLHHGMLQKQSQSPQMPLGALMQQQPNQLAQSLQLPMASQNMMNSGALQLQNIVTASGQQQRSHGLMGSAFHPPRQHHT